MTPYISSPECSWRDYCPEQTSLTELSFAQCPCPPRSLPWQTPSIENGRNLSVFSLSVFIISPPWSTHILSLAFAGVDRLPAPSLHLLVRPRQSALAFLSGRKHQISRGTFRYWKNKKVGHLWSCELEGVELEYAEIITGQEKVADAEMFANIPENDFILFLLCTSSITVSLCTLSCKFGPIRSFRTPETLT